MQYRPRPPVPRKIDPYKAIIVSRLEEFPKLTATRLFHEIRAAGYTGDYTQVKEFVRQVRPRPPQDPVIRFETPPGHQAQVDLAHFRFHWGPRYDLLVVLGYSRLLWLRFYARQDMRTLFSGLEEAFGFFGGVPREILFDQMRSVVVADRRGQGGPLIQNLEFLSFAHPRGFRPRACRPYRARTKGKVERPIRYVRKSFVYGRSFVGDGDLNEQAERWLRSVAKCPDPRTTGERPIERFEREVRTHLGPLARRPLKRLLGTQITVRANRCSQAAMRSSQPAAVKTLEDFDFSFQPGRLARRFKMLTHPSLLVVTLPITRPEARHPLAECAVFSRPK